MKGGFYLLFLLMSFGPISAQTIKITDTIELARSKAQEKNFSAADRLLTHYNSAHKDVNALRLHAQVLYQMNLFKRSGEVYEKALVVYPDVHVIKLDYARMLFETGNYSYSTSLLEAYKTRGGGNPEANLLLARLYYWTGDIVKAQARLKDVLQPYPANLTALNIQQEINTAIAPFIIVRGVYNSDNQPLKSVGQELEAGVYRSRFIAPKLQLNYNHFTLPDTAHNSLWLQLGNKISLGKTGLSINATGGLFIHHINDGKSRLTGNITAYQKLSRALSLELSVAKKPYQYAAMSIRVPVIETMSYAAVNLNKSNKWLGRAAYQLERFDDNNKVQTIYAWFLAPIVNTKTFNLKGGYAFNHSNADRNTFASVKSLNNVIQTTPMGGMIPGIYDPYFTPRNQIVHSALISAGVMITDKINFSSRLSMGISASADNPYLFLNKDINNNIVINTDYSKIDFKTSDFQNELSVKISKKIAVSGMYGFSKLLFSSFNRGALQLKYDFINEKRK